MKLNKPLIIANWKMNRGTAAEAKAFCAEFLALLQPSNVSIVLCPPFTALEATANLLASSQVALGAQNCHEAIDGAYTGEVSAKFLKELGCSCVLLGHSERRQYQKEDDALINRKIMRALALGLTPVVCVGESLEEREANFTFQKISNQLEASLGSLDCLDVGRLVLAYEPIWAIGTGKTATPSQAQDVHAFIRGWLVDHFAEVAESVILLYGGSVKSSNAKELMAQPDIDGALVGGASLVAKEFWEIVAQSR